MLAVLADVNWHLVKFTRFRSDAAAAWQPGCQFIKGTFSDSGILISSPSGFRSGLHQEKARGDKPAASISLLTHG
jgi:hypothetical protein